MAAFFWNEARNEVVYLCGNFTEGVSGRSVLTQLDTAELSEYRVMETAGGTRIVSEANLTHRWKPQVKISADAAYGLGWMSSKKKGLRLIAHGGGTMGTALVNPLIIAHDDRCRKRFTVIRGTGHYRFPDRTG